LQERNMEQLQAMLQSQLALSETSVKPKRHQEKETDRTATSLAPQPEEGFPAFLIDVEAERKPKRPTKREQRLTQQCLEEMETSNH